ncbi:MAG: siphovirus ReqiPepy6 Gp37-like family protein [Bdellovibrionales bacterium]|nr:siphovirus ReqiPepy6 Gp37-like family protein [Bdellovibrionales bacterium]
MNKVPIKLFDSNLNFVANLSAYESLTFTRSHRGIGDFELKMSYGAPYADIIRKDMFIEVDDRTDVIGIVEYKQYTEDGDGDGMFTIKGMEAKGIFERRLIFPTAGYSYNVEIGQASTIMQNYVKESAGSDAAVSRRFPFLIVDEVTQGANLRRQARYKNLATELEEIATADSSGWRLYRDGKNLRFKYVKGINRVSSQSVNPSVIFSDQFDNLEETDYIEDFSSYKNVAVIAGEGAGVNRVVYEENLGTFAGLERREYFVDARDIQSENVPSGELESTLRARAREKLEEVAPIQTFENGIISGTFGAFRYLEDWDLGDVVTALNTKVGLTADAQITMVHESYTGEGFKIDVEIGEPIRGVKKALEIRTSRLDGELYR